MLRQCVVILGGGLSGLVAAWTLARAIGPRYRILLLERADCLGGLIRTSQESDFLFEHGPRGCLVRQADHPLFQLIQELGLESEVIAAPTAVRQKYIRLERGLVPVPTNLWSLWRSPLLPSMVKMLWREWRAPACSSSDETVYDFAARRFGQEVAENVFDPLVRGVFAGDARELSLKAAFPVFHQLEERFGSFSRAYLAMQGQRLFSKQSAHPLRHRFFTFRNGMAQLIQRLVEHLSQRVEIYSGTAVTSIRAEEKGLIIKTPQQEFQAAYCISALPAWALAETVSAAAPELERALRAIPFRSLTTVHLGYRHSVWQQPGFGYLLPSALSPHVLGVSWDSSLLPQQNRHPQETRLTVMIGSQPGSLYTQDCQGIALRTVAEHLGIIQAPDLCRVETHSAAIPQYTVGHLARVKKIESLLKRDFAQLTCVGQSFYGIGVNDCVSATHKIILRETSQWKQ